MYTYIEREIHDSMLYYSMLNYTTLGPASARKPPPSREHKRRERKTPQEDRRRATLHKSIYIYIYIYIYVRYIYIYICTLYIYMIHIYIYILHTTLYTSILYYMCLSYSSILYLAYCQCALCYARRAVFYCDAVQR